MRTISKTLVAAAMLAGGLAAAPALLAQDSGGGEGHPAHGGAMGGTTGHDGMPMMSMMQRMNRMMESCEKMMGAMTGGRDPAHPGAPAPQQAPSPPARNG